MDDLCLIFKRSLSAAVVSRVQEYRRGARITFDAVVERIDPLDRCLQFRIEVVGDHIVHCSGFEQAL